MIFCRWFATLPVIAAVALVAVLPVTAGETAVPKRIVSLAPSLTELVYAAGAGDQLVAVSAFSDFPPEAKRLPQVSDASGIAWESLLAQKPDLVLAWQDGTRPADIARLQSLKIDVAILTIRTLDDVPIALRKIGALTGRASASEWERSRRSSCRFRAAISACHAARVSARRATCPDPQNASSVSSW